MRSRKVFSYLRGAAWAGVASAMSCFYSAGASAALILSNAGDQGSIDGAIFYVPNNSFPISNANTFLRLQDGNDADSLQFGFNTTLTPPTVLGTHDQDFQPSIDDALTLGEIPAITIGGTQYLEFVLAVNQQGNNTISLDELVIAESNTAAVSDFTTLTKVYEMTSDTVTIRSVYGGTNLDMALFIPSNLFSLSNVVLFAKFSDSDDGPERWGVNRNGDPFTINDPPNPPDGVGGPAQIPEPGTLALFGTALLGMGVVRRRRRR